MKCCVGVLTAELHIDGSQSLKDRRKVLQSVKERVRHRFNVSICEAAEGDEKWQRAGLIVTCAGTSPAGVEHTLRAVADLMEGDPRIGAVTANVRYYE